MRRRSEPEGDHELHATLERMRESHPHLWEVIHRVHLSGDADRPKLEEWRRAPDDIGLRWGTYTITPAGFYFLEGGLPEPKDSLRELAKKPGGSAIGAGGGSGGAVRQRRPRPQEPSGCSCCRGRTPKGQYALP